MSFILDALRKSESERQRQSTPGLVDAGYRPPARRRGIWLPLLVVVLVANLLVMGYFWLRRDTRPAAEATAAASPADTAPAPAGGNPAAIGGAGNPAEADYEATADMPAVEPEPGTVAPEPAPAAAPPAAATAAAGPGPTSHIVTSEDLPTAEQLMASGVIPSQSLHLDIHVYSKAPAERFVFINMRKYTEGAQLPEGPKVEEITRDGVVLSQAGQHFVLSRD